MTPEIYALPTFTEHLLGDFVDDPRALDPKSPLRDHVSDSVALIELCVILEQLGVDASLVDLTKQPTLEDLYNLYVDSTVL